MSIVPSPTPRNAWERASLVLGSGFLTKSGRIQALKPLGGIGDLPFLRNSAAWQRGASGSYGQIGIDIGLINSSIEDGKQHLAFEPSSTNGLFNPIMQGASVGSPGTLPSGWDQFLAGLNYSVLALPIVDSIQCIDLRFHGVATSVNANVYLSPNLQVPASPGDQFCFSSWLQKLSSQPNAYFIEFPQYNSGGSYITSGLTPLPLNTDFKRMSFGLDVTNPTTAFVQPTLRFVLTPGQSYDFSIRIGWPQLEPHPYPTSIMVSNGTSAFIRAVSQFPVNNLQSNAVFGATTGTLCIDLIKLFANAANTAPLVFRRSDGTELIRFEANGIANQFRVNFPTLGQSTAYAAMGKVSIAWNGANVRIAYNGAVVATFAGSIGAVDQVRYTGNGMVEFSQLLCFPTSDTDSQLINYVA